MRLDTALVLNEVPMPEVVLPEGRARQAIEDALADRQSLALPPELADTYEEMHGGRRLTRLVRAQVVNSITVLLGVPIQWFDNPAVLPASLTCSLAVSSVFLISAALLKWMPRKVPETWVFGLPHLALMALLEVMGQRMSAHLADRYMIVAFCCIAATISLTTIRMKTALVLAGGAAVLAPLVPLLVRGPVHFPLDLDLPLIAVGGLGIALLVARRNERERRRDFLLTLQHDIAAAEIKEMNVELARLSNTDALTGLANRRQLDTEMAALSQAVLTPAIGVVLIDIDHFKLFNDSAGHAAGDQCLRRVAQALGAEVRRGDLVARYGGEEFAVVLRQVPWEELLYTAERLRLAVASLELPHPGLVNSFVTISLGVARTEGSERTEADALLLQADKALYEAKRAGRNQVAAWQVLAQAEAGIPGSGKIESAAER